MAVDRKPLVLDDAAQLQQLQAVERLDIPLQKQHDDLQERFDLLVRVLLAHGIPLPGELIER